MKATYKNSKDKSSEKGFILITVLVMVVALSLMGITSMIVSSNEVLIAGNINKSKEAFYITEAALEEAKYFVLNDPMKGTATAKSADTLTDNSQVWNADEWANMQVIDNLGTRFTIVSNTADTLTLSAPPPATIPTAPPVAPELGSYHIMYKVVDDLAIESGVGDGVGSANTLTVAGKTWATNQWLNCNLTDGIGTVFTINANGADFLTVVGTPISGNWSIRNKLTGSVDTMHSVSAYNFPQFIIDNPVGWVLIDSANNKFDIDDVTGFGINDINLVNGAGTPANGSFDISRPGWMYDARSPISGNGTVSTRTTTYNIGSAVGTVVVTISKRGANKGFYTMQSIGTIAKSRKGITVSIDDTGNGDVLIRDWQEMATP